MGSQTKHHMDLVDRIPLVVYDDNCYLCVKFAKMINVLSRGKLPLVGHYTKLGEQIRNEMLDSSALEMFWFIDERMAFGGRAALIPLFKAILSSKKSPSKLSVQENCDIKCKTPKAVFVRSASLLSNSKKILLKKD